jgi:hypothetical protein
MALERREGCSDQVKMMISGSLFRIHQWQSVLCTADSKASLFWQQIPQRLLAFSRRQGADIGCCLVESTKITMLTL